MKKLICIMGPTGAGKTGISLELAKYYPITVINADSRQTYADFPIISAQPSAEEKSFCPHMLYGYLKTEEQSSVGDWMVLARKQIEFCHQNNKIPVLVGGTGFYFKSLLDGIAKIPDVPMDIHEKYIYELEQFGSKFMYEKLLKVDFEYAQKIHFNDKQRIARALEVFEATERPLSSWHKENPKPINYDVLRIGIGIELKDLTPILYKRTEIMLKNNALAEAKQAFEINSDLSAPGWTGIGCREIINYLLGNYDLNTCMDLWNKNTRAYAKRQWTWFRADQRITWFSPYAFNLKIVEDFLENL